MWFFEVLETSNLFGVKLNKNHIEELFEIFSNPASIRYTDNALHQTRSDTETLLKRFRKEFREQSAVRWGIRLKSSERIIGLISLYHVDHKHRIAVLGCLLHEPFQGQGIMPEIQKAVFRFAFEKMNVHRIEGQCYTGNTWSIKNLESVGMKREGHLRENFLIDGTFRDSFIYSLLKSDFDSDKL